MEKVYVLSRIINNENCGVLGVCKTEELAQHLCNVIANEMSLGELEFDNVDCCVMVFSKDTREIIATYQAYEVN